MVREAGHCAEGKARNRATAVDTSWSAGLTGVWIGDRAIVAYVLMVWAELESDCKENDQDTAGTTQDGYATLRNDGGSVTGL